MEWERTDARIGSIHFGTFNDGAYSDPDVAVDSEANTVEHQTINDKTVIQQLGSKPDKLTIEGVIPEDEALKFDQLVESGVVSLRTERWSGTVIVNSTSTSFRRARDDAGNWLVDFTIQATEVNEQTAIDQEPNPQGRVNWNERHGGVNPGSLMTPQFDIDSD